ncbi:hypothetical protein QJS66_00970 [Kocuria rhizophila]|nr:hypothetical protein QJS66_00970 [Kocuria rhizophila]
MRDSYRALATLAQERRRLLGTPRRPPRRTDADALEEQAARTRAEAEQLAERVTEAQQVWKRAQQSRAEAEDAARAAEKRSAELVRRTGARVRRGSRPP